MKNMDQKTKRLISALKKKREAEGHSLRQLSSIIGVSFSSLARMERGEGEPDNNSRIRILEWLGEEERDSSGLSFESVALVHFRASKNVDSKTIDCLLQVADFLKSKRGKKGLSSHPAPVSTTEPPSVALQKPEMELMAKNFREDLGLKDNKPLLSALSVQIDGVEALTIRKIEGLDPKIISYLEGKGSDHWSAMSVPLDENNDSWAVVRNDRHTLERQRVTYLEECWHILLGHKLTKIAKIANSYGRTFEHNEEHDAYYLAAATLLPEEAIKESVEKKKDINELGKEFGTSPELVEYRIKRLGLWREYKGKNVQLSEDI